MAACRTCGGNWAWAYRNLDVGPRSRCNHGAAPVIGTRINNYEIVSQIGEGGMGAVYLARHPMIDRQVAVKVLRPGLAGDPTLVARFFNEARAANAIRHPNIIEILDVGTLPDGTTPYLMMEMLEGENLARRLRRTGKMRIEEAVDLARQTASALGAAHDKGIVHRDLKPENLFLIPDPTIPGRDRMKVLDFGIAKLRGTISGVSVHTQTGSLMGTPPYMSPEQCRGVNNEVDSRTDIYALGIILYEMLCGTPPFVGEGFGELVVMHLTQPPQPVRERNPSVPEALQAVVMQALAKRAAERFATMKEFEAALMQGPITARPAPTESTTRDAEPIRLTEVAAPPHTTTFSISAGELESVTEAPGRKRNLLLATGGVAAAVIVAALGFGRGGAQKQTASGPRTQPALAAAMAPTLHADAGVSAGSPRPAAVVPPKKVRRRSNVPAPPPVPGVPAVPAVQTMEKF